MIMSSYFRDRTVVILGPTAIGKSRLALRLAPDFGGEIVNADSRQVYRYMDIGTSKPTREQRTLVPHHLIDVVNPDEAFTLAGYQELVYKAMDDIQAGGKLPLLVGGTGLYIWAVVEGWQIPRVAPHPELRQKLLARAAGEGALSLYQELERVDPLAAQRIDWRNVRRVIRALEVYHTTGIPFSQHGGKKLPAFRSIIIGLTTDRQELHRLIDGRVDDMIQQGLVEETKSLLARGYPFALPAMSSLGYKQIGSYLKGELALPHAIQQMKFETHRLARHQYAWFRPADDRIHWFDTRQDVTATVAEFLRGELASK